MLLHGFVRDLCTSQFCLPTRELINFNSNLNNSLPSSKPAVIVPTGPTSEIVLTHAQLYNNIETIARVLQASGVASHDVVAMLLPNGIEIVVGFFATGVAGAAANPLNPQYTEDEIAFYLEDTKCRFMLVPPGLSESSPARRAAKRFNATCWEISYDPKANAVVLQGLGVASGNPDSLPSLVPPQPNQTALILHTSGTTSRPKAVPLTHKNLRTSALNIAQTYHFTPDDTGFLVMPLFHVHGLLAGLIAPLLAGGAIVIQPGKFSASSFWKHFFRYRCSWFTAVPTMHQILLQQYSKLSKEAQEEFKETLRKQGRLRFVRSCSSALAPAVHQQLEALYGVPVVEAYAMTEATHQMTSNNLPPKKRIAGSVGQAEGTVEVAIMDDSGNPVPAGTEGEVCVRGPTITPGYLNNPKANAETFTKTGFLRTGDRGYMDAEGFVYLTGRLKEMINRGGEKIMPGEIDAALLSHPAIAEAVAFGAPNSLLGQEVHAAIVVKAGQPVPTFEDIKRFLRSKLATFKIPVKIHYATELPRTATGKIQRRHVASHFLESQAQASTQARQPDGRSML